MTAVRKSDRSLIGAFLSDLFSEMYQFFPISLISLKGCAVRVVFLCQFIHCDALLLNPANFELRITIYWISLEKIVNSSKILFDTSLPRVVDHKMLFLCVRFAVPSTMGSPLLSDVVRDGDCIQSPLTKIFTGFAFNKEMSTSAIDHSLIPTRRHSEHCTFGIVSHNSNNFKLPISRIIAFESSLKCFSMKMTLDLIHEFSNSEVFCLFHNCMWQSRHSEVNVYFFALCEQTDGLSAHWFSRA